MTACEWLEDRWLQNLLDYFGHMGDEAFKRKTNELTAEWELMVGILRMKIAGLPLDHVEYSEIRSWGIPPEDRFWHMFLQIHRTLKATGVPAPNGFYELALKIATAFYEGYVIDHRGWNELYQTRLAEFRHEIVQREGLPVGMPWPMEVHFPVGAEESLVLATTLVKDVEDERKVDAYLLAIRCVTLAARCQGSVSRAYAQSIEWLQAELGIPDDACETEDPQS